MWPELLSYPFNPPETLGQHAKVALKWLGVYPWLKRMKYGWNRLLYHAAPGSRAPKTRVAKV